MTHDPSHRSSVRWLMPAAIVVFVSVFGVSTAVAEFELTILGGLSLPTYEQTFSFDVDDAIDPDLPITSSGQFAMQLEGAAAFSGALAWRFSDSWGLEARLDWAEVDLEVQGGQLLGDLGDLIPSFPNLPVSAELAGQAEIDPLTPISLNLQFVRGDRLRFVASGGLSYLPDISVLASVSLLISVDTFVELSLPELSATAGATIEGGFGGNLGLGLRYSLGPRWALALDGRAFVLPERTLEWGSSSDSISGIGEVLAENLDPIRFEFGFFQVTGGVSYRF